MKYFDFKGFYTYYINKSKFKNKENLFNDFKFKWYDKFGYNRSLPMGSWETINGLWTSSNKKVLKIELQGMGYTTQSIDGLFNSLTSWLKATK